MKKSPWLSKTLWTAAATFIGVVIVTFTQDENLAAQVQEVVAMALPLVMLVLRLVTHQPVGTDD